MHFGRSKCPFASARGGDVVQSDRLRLGYLQRCRRIFLTGDSVKLANGILRPVEDCRRQLTVPARAEYIGKFRWARNDLRDNAVSRPVVAMYGGHRRG
jgi:hypothetical protein